jgi:WD40-like Beta Propeller Repeat
MAKDTGFTRPQRLATVPFTPLLALVLVGAAIIVPQAQAACPNEAIRASQASQALPQGTTAYPACMALEMVTPPQKFGQETLTVTAFSPDGNRVLFTSKAALADTEGLQAFGGDSYVATREAGGWVTSPTSPPRSADISAGSTKRGGPYAFTPSLGSWIVLGATQAQEFGGKAQIFSGDLGGLFAPLSPLLVPIDDSGFEELPLFIGSRFAPSGTAADLSTTAFRAEFPFVAYFPEDPRSPETDGATNSYLAFRDGSGEPALRLLARDQSGKVWGGRCGADVGGGGSLSASGGGLNQGAISPDGSRILFSTRPAQPFDPAHPTEDAFSPPCDLANPLRILIRTGEGPAIEELVPGPGGPSEAGDDLYQGASVDGSKVFLTSPRKLAGSDLDTSAEPCGADLGASKGCDLYLYDAELPTGSRLIQVSAGEDVAGKHEAGKGADVLSSISSISADGSHAYFAAQGVLSADANPDGKVAQAGQPNLYLYARDAAHPSGELSFIATLAAGDKGTLWGGTQSLATGAYPVPLSGSPAGGDGHTLLFLTKAPLSSEDADGAHADAYRYDSQAETLACISCAGGDSSAFDVLAGSVEGSSSSNFAEQGRWASDDGETIAFATAAPLVESDEDEEVNPYLWRQGQLLQLPGVARLPFQPYKLPTVSTGGEQVAFTTETPLLPQDGDATRDAYVVRVDGGFPNPPPAPTPCDPLSEGACQGSPSGPRAGISAGSPFFAGPGNQKAPAKCRKGQVKKRGSCVKQRQAKKKQSKHKRGSRKRASHTQGGSR